jgi:predicted transcriptional regulator
LGIHNEAHQEVRAVKVSEVMTHEVTSIGPEAALKEAAMLMVNAGVSGLPVVDDKRRVIGIITEADFVSAEAERAWGRQRKRLLANVFGEAKAIAASNVGDVMSKSLHTIDRDNSVTEAARRMTDLGVKRLPVVTPDGTLDGIVSRADVMGAFARSDDELKAEIVADVVERVMRLDPATIGVDLDDGLVTLSGAVETKSEARLLEELAVRVEGVVSVDSNLTYTRDDTR